MYCAVDLTKVAATLRAGFSYFGSCVPRKEEINMRNLNVTVAVDGGVTVTNGTGPVSYSGEHNATRLSVLFSDLSDSIFSGADYFRVVFGGQYSERISILGNGFTYDIPQSVTVPPSVRCQISGFRESGGETVFIAKSAVFCFDVEASEPGKYEINPDTELFFKTVARCEAAAQRAEEISETVSGYAASASAASASADTACLNAERYASAASASAGAAGQSAINAASAAQTATSKAAEAALSAETVTDYASSLHGHKTGNLIFADDISAGNMGEGLSATVSSSGRSEVTVVNGEDLYFENMRYFSPTDELFVTVTSPFGSSNKGITVYTSADVENDGRVPTTLSYEVFETGVICTAHFVIEDGVLSYDYVLYYTGYDVSQSFSGSTALEDGAKIVSISGVEGDLSGGNTVTARAVSNVSEPQSVTVTGRNLLPLYKSQPSTVYSSGGFTITLKDGDIVLDGMLADNVNSTYDCFKTGFLLDLPTGTYSLSYCGDGISAENCKAVINCIDDGVSQTVAEANISQGDGLCNYCEFTVEAGKEYYFGITLAGSANNTIVFSDTVLPVTVEKTYSGSYRSALPIEKLTVYESGELDDVPSYYPEMTAFISEGTLTFDYKVDTDIAYRRLVSAINALGGTVTV